jgi:hypothetical protein
MQDSQKSDASSSLWVVTLYNSRHDETEIVGIYSTHEAAQALAQRVEMRDAFRNMVEIAEFPLNRAVKLEFDKPIVTLYVAAIDYRDAKFYRHTPYMTVIDSVASLPAASVHKTAECIEARSYHSQDEADTLVRQAWQDHLALMQKSNEDLT